MPVTVAQPVAPFYFGAREGERQPPLFGCYHEPRRGSQRSCAVLICPPAGHEYINCHRALRQLGARLCESGFPVLRFDYYGCGDSAGDSSEGTVPRWLQDVDEALGELRRRSGLHRLCVVGLRLGASLAMISGARRGDLESLVLWDPVIDGNSYLNELVCLQNEMSRFRPRTRSIGKTCNCLEILGFPIGHGLRAELEATDLSILGKAPAKNVLVIESQGDAVPDMAGQDKAFTIKPRQVLSRSLASAEHQHVESPPIWLPSANGSLLVPFRLLQTVVAWVARTHA